MIQFNKLAFVLLKKYSLQLSSRKTEMKMDLLDPVMTDKLPLNIENIHGK